jgi:MFS family permease
MTAHASDARARASERESPYAWARLGTALLLGTIGGVGMWSVVVSLPVVQAEFGVTRNAASLPYTLAMLGFGAGGVLIGRMVDRWGVIRPLIGAIVALALGYVAAGSATSLWQFALAHGLLIGFGGAATFGPLMADTSHWFDRHRGIAITVCASGNYLAGTLWPEVVQHFVNVAGWRPTYIGIGLFCLATMLPLMLMLRRPPPSQHGGAAMPRSLHGGSLALRRDVLMALLCLAGLACCTAMSMPQVHLVAYCGDLGYGVGRGAEMVSLMMFFGIVSRIGSGFVADAIGGLGTLLLGSALQGVALALYLGFDGLSSLYVISALFGLFQGGIVPSYAIIVREYFPPEEAGWRVGVVLFATLLGMAFGGWVSGAIFDLTGSYRAAFANGLAWNLLNGAIAVFLLTRRRGRPPRTVTA